MNDVIELVTRVLCDARDDTPVDGVYLYCQTEDSQQAVLQAAVACREKCWTAKVFVLQSTAKSGYPGFAPWCACLQKIGLSSEQIEGVAISETATLNTLIESQALVRFARARGYRSIAVIAPPFQQLRAFMTAVTVALREYPRLRLYSYPAVAMLWQEEVVHSQGALRARRSELIHTELDRINIYQEKGDLASFAQVLAYLNKREAGG